MIFGAIFSTFVTDQKSTDSSSLSRSGAAPPEDGPHARCRFSSGSLRDFHCSRPGSARFCFPRIVGRSGAWAMPGASVYLAEKSLVLRESREKHVPMLHVRCVGQSPRSLGGRDEMHGPRGRGRLVHQAQSRHSLDSPQVTPSFTSARDREEESVLLRRRISPLEAKTRTSYPLENAKTPIIRAGYEGIQETPPADLSGSSLGSILMGSAILGG